jgi:NTP pyrophosphatase (non-canonical NTP hydrolase)
MTGLSLRSLAKSAHSTAVEKGWWEGVVDPTIVCINDDGRRERSLPEQFMLMVSEISEAMEEIRKPNARPFYLKDDKPEGWGVELADCVIRIMDTCERYNVDLQGLVEMKMKYNESRSHRHGNKVL